MKNKIYTLIILLFGVIEIFAQAPGWQWAKRGGGTNSDTGTKIYTDANGNSYVTGYYYSAVCTFGSYTLNNMDGSGNSGDIFIAKQDVWGNLLWAKSAGETGLDYANSIGVDASGNSYITGTFGSDTIFFGSISLILAPSSYKDIFIAKYDPSGNVVWAKKANGDDYDEAYGLTTDPAGNSYITGIFNSDSLMFDNITLYNVWGADFFIAKYNSSGNVQWAKSAGSVGLEYGNGIGADAFGNTFVIGPFSDDSVTFDGYTVYHSTSSGNDAFIVAYNASGNVQWVKTVWANNWVNINDISTDMFGNINITGDFHGSAANFGSIVLTNVNSSTNDIFVAKYNAAGNVLWAKRAGADSIDWGTGIVTDVNGNCYVTGNFNSPTITFGTTVLLNLGGNCGGFGCGDIFVVKYDLSGNVLWAKSAGGTASDYSRSISIDGTGNVYITGYYISHPINFGSTALYNAAGLTGTSDFFIAKTNFSTGMEEENSFSNTINIFPNPGNGQVNITSPDIIDEIEIRDVLGQIIYKAAPQERKVELNINGEGIYFVSVRMGKEMLVRKVVEVKD